MGDRHRLTTPRQMTATTAAARILRPTRADAPKAQQWHEPAWRYRDTIGELHFAEMWLSNAFSRSRLFAARRPAPGEEPEPVEDGPAFELIAQLAGGVGGQAALLRAFGPFILVPGVGYLVGDPNSNPTKFEVVDAEDLRLGRNDATTGERVYDLRVDDGVQGWRSLTPNTIITKVHRPHPRRRWEPDSPTRAALPILRELELLTMHVEATALSRLAGAGIQAWPAEIDFENGWDAFVETMIDAISKPAKDRSLAAALVPFPVKMPGDRIQQWKEGFLSYSTAFDDKSIELREEAITRLGNAMDMPRQVLTGEQRNHWGDWQIEESGLKMHVEPGLETICEGLTVGYLNPGLTSSREGDLSARTEIERVEAESPDGEWIVWYDTADLRVRPDRSGAATDAYDRWEAGGDDLRKELGITDATALDPNSPEGSKRVWLTLLNTNLAPLAIEKLGLASAEEIQAVLPKGTEANPVVGEDTVKPPGEDDDGGRGPRSLPQTRDQQPPTAPGPGSPAALPAAASSNGNGDAEVIDVGEIPDHPPALTPGVAIVAALDGIVVRAMERAGRRALNKMPKPNGRSPRHIEGQDCPAERLHTCTDLTKLLPVHVLFEDAWSRVPEVAERLGEDAPALIATCDAYVRVLVRTQTEHTWSGLARALGITDCPCEADDVATAP